MGAAPARQVAARKSEAAEAIRLAFAGATVGVQASVEKPLDPGRTIDAEVAADGGIIEKHEEALESYALGLRLTVAFSVGLAIVIGVLRIIKGWPIQYLIIGGYVVVVGLTFVAVIAFVIWVIAGW